MRGRKPKPSRAKELAGNPGRRKINRLEPRPASGVVIAPTWLEGMARKLWDARAEELVEAGVLTAWDAELFAGFCQAYAAAVQASEEGREAVKLWGLVRSLGSEFGLSPVSRSRIQVKRTEQSAVQKILDRKKACLRR